MARSVELRNEPVLVFDWITGPHAFLELTYVTNPGAAWSLFSDYPVALTVLAAVALLSIFLFGYGLQLTWFQKIVSGLLAFMKKDGNKPESKKI